MTKDLYIKEKHKYLNLKLLSNKNIIGIPKFNKEKWDSKKYISEGKNGKVYVVCKNNKKWIIKEQELFYDLPFILESEGIMCSMTQINDLIISNIVSKLKDEYFWVQQFEGYRLEDNFIFFKKEYVKVTLSDYLKSGIDKIKKIKIILSCFLTLYLIFQKSLIGHHGDFKVDNILLYPTEQKYRLVELKDKVIKIETDGYIPTLTDFGASVIIDQNKIYKKYNWKKLKEKGKKYKCPKTKFNKSLDLKYFLEINENLIPNEIKQIYGKNEDIEVSNFFEDSNLLKYFEY